MPPSVTLMILSLSSRTRACPVLSPDTLQLVSHPRIAHVHLPPKVISQSAVVVELAQIGSTDFAHLQLLL